MPSLDPCTCHGMRHLGWGSSTAPDSAQPGQHLLCLGVLLQGAWNLILAAVVEPFHLLFWEGALGCHLPVQALSAWGEIPWLKCLPPLLPQFPQMSAWERGLGT